MRKSIFFSFAILITVITVVTASTSDTDYLTTTVKNKTQYILQVLSNKRLDKDKKNSEILNSVEFLFDFDLMAKLSIGKSGWSQLTDDQRMEYLALYQDKIEQLYLETFHAYTGQDITISPARQITEARIVVPSYISNGASKSEVLYKFYKKENRDWLIYDVEIEGVSIVQTYRSEFTELLKTGTVQDLLDKLRQRLSE